jgi:Xaa-Pro aminopeptidase
VDHRLRRARLAELFGALGIDAVLVTRAANVRYLTGFTGSNGQALLTRDGGVLLTDGRYAEQAARQAPDLDRAIYADGFARVVRAHTSELAVRRLGIEAGDVSVRAWAQLRAGLESVALVELDDEVDRLRWAKDPDELASLRRAQELTDVGFDAALTFLRGGMSEREAAWQLEVAIREAGADGLAFEPIVAFGPSAAEPHHEPTERRLAPGDVVKLDFGALADGYHADMTRTIALGEPPSELREIHAVVAEAQRAGIGAVREGATGREVDLAARAVVSEAGYGDRYTHGLGHGVGLQIHEGPFLRALSRDVLPAGAVVTVEPGIYVRRLGGVRIEDSVVVEPGGARPLPRSTKELLVL